MTSKIIISLTILLLLIAAPLFADPIELTVTPSDTEITLGDPVSVDVNIAGLGDGEAPSLSTYDLILQFDSLILSFLSVDWGAELGPVFGSYQENAPTSDGHSFLEFSFDWPEDLDLFQPSAFTLFTANFSSIAIGTSPLVLNSVILGDSIGAPLNFSATNSSVNVTSSSSVATPEPGVLSLLVIAGLGLVMLSLYRRRLI